MIGEKTDQITRFIGPWEFLSLGYPFELMFEGIRYPSLAHAWVATMTTDQEMRHILAEVPNLGRLERLRKIMEVRPDWESIRMTVLEQLCREKFSNPTLRATLLVTGNVSFIYGNNQHDNFLGSCICALCKEEPKTNALGNLLMQIRDELRQGGR